MKSAKLIIGVLFIVALAVLQSCEGRKQSGRLKIYLTDAPFPMEMIEEATITINKVEVRRTDVQDENPYMVVSEESRSFNLLDLRNGVTEVLVDIEVPAGSYDLVRLYVEEAGLKIVDGDSYTVKVPSGAQTGIKLFIEPELVVGEGLTEELLLDFNLERSFVLQGSYDTPAGIKGFHFKPVIRAVNSSIAGTLQGIVKDTASVVVPVAEIWVEQDTLVASTFTDSLGFYKIIGLPGGIYELFAAKENFDTLSKEVVIIPANRTTHNLVLMPK